MVIDCVTLTTRTGHLTLTSCDRYLSRDLPRGHAHSSGHIMSFSSNIPLIFTFVHCLQEKQSVSSSVTDHLTSLGFRIMESHSNGLERTYSALCSIAVTSRLVLELEGETSFP